MGEKMHVNIEALNAVALKTSFKANGEASLGSTTFGNVADGAKGLQVQAALAGAQERWDASAKRLSGELELFAGALAEAAAAVENTDDGAGKLIEQVRVA